MKARRQGTTLPELMIVMAIMSILLYLAQSLIVSGYQFYRSIDESITLQREGLLALTRITQDAALTHHRSLVVEEDTVKLPSPPEYQEDKLLMPLPRNVAGKAVVNSKGALTWRSLVGYEINTADHTLMRYLVDSKDDPLGQFMSQPEVVGDPLPAFPDDYIENIEFVTSMPAVSTLPGFPSLNARVAARNVLELKVTKKLDTLDIDLTIFLTGRVQGGVSLDNSLTLQTTVFPKN